MFYEPKTNTIHIRYASEGGPSSMSEKDEYKNQLNQFGQSGMSVLFIAMFHSHPNEDPQPTSFAGDMDVISNRNIGVNAVSKPGDVSTKPGGPPVGFIIYGLGKYTPYNQNGVRVVGSGEMNTCR